ncbi:MAG TPA: YggS family pyridoxal phosphate-dependent enzyme [Actinomycetota bacterium]|nr:YggS family pyridoxal phosphate-dependent enzyme [Actinomycetota bacterium]
MGNVASSLQESLARVRERVTTAAERAGRSPADVTLVAVSKTFPIDVIQKVIECGAADLGENRAQEFREKVAALGDAARWHFVGPLQTNKVRIVVGAAQLIHSVDRLQLAEAISRRAAALDIVQEVLLEVNITGEAAKHGAEPGRAVELGVAMHGLGNLTVSGLMTMAPFSDDPETSRPYFRQLAQLRDEVAAVVPGATGLSMGMSRDFEVGIEEGATLVRVGEAIFGSRAH